MIEILKRLPRTNCKTCGEPTCMVFAVRMTEGAKGAHQRPHLDPQQRAKLNDYLSRFNLLD